MKGEYRPYNERTPDEQYKNLIRAVLDQGTWGPSPMVDENGKEVRTIDLLGAPVMRFDLLKNGVPFITERKLGFWKAAVGGCWPLSTACTPRKGLKNIIVNGGKLGARKKVRKAWSRDR